MKQIFKTLACIFAAATIAFFMESCKKDFFDGDPEQMSRIGVERTISVSAILPQGGEKAYLDYNDDRRVKLELTDSLNINGTNIPLASLNADRQNARFEGTTYALQSGSNEIYWAVYPTTLAGAASGSSIPSNFTASTLMVNFPTTQTYNSSADALSGNTFMAGYASVPAGTGNIVFQMRNIGTVLKLHLTAKAGVANTNASKLVFSTTNGALAGNFTVSNNTTTPTITPTASATQTLTVNLTDGTNNYIDISSGADIFVILPPFASKNLSVKIYAADNGYYTEKSVSTTTCLRNLIYTNAISNIDFGAETFGFSVSPTKKIYFAPGNLQWSYTNGGSTATTHLTADSTGNGTFRFAPNQWDCIGNNSGNTTKIENGRATQADWIDLFGWGTSGYASKDPWTIQDVGTQLTTNIAGTNYDWGVYNEIYNTKTGTLDPVGTWRTPTDDEWNYILNTRTVTCGIRFVVSTVHGIPGIIIVPDNWDATTYTFNNPNDYGHGFAGDVIADSDWVLLENTGCVFLPAGGIREGVKVKTDDENANAHGQYWSSTIKSKGKAYYFHLCPKHLWAQKEDDVKKGFAVRLVREF